jgi:GMP synthase (glutamine-hydrolysing)
MMSNDVLVLQHIACEPPAAYEDVLRERDLGLVRIEIDEGDELPDWREFSAIVAMGGPMGAYDDEAHPWLAAERRLIAEAVRADVPFWGVCLGAQLLAASLGAAVYPGAKPEVGIESVRLAAAADEDPVFGHAPREFAVLQWHSDTFDLPKGAALLAVGETYRHQAFAWRRAYGMQFHLEVSPSLAAEWARVPAYAEALERLNGPGALDRLVKDLEERSSEITPLARRLFSYWLDEVVPVETTQLKAVKLGGIESQ